MSSAAIPPSAITSTLLTVVLASGAVCFASVGVSLVHPAIDAERRANRMICFVMVLVSVQ